MLNLRNASGALALLCPLLLVSSIALPQASGVPAPIKVETLSPTTFKALPDSAVIEAKDGSRTTAGALREKHRQLEAELETKKAVAAAANRAKFEAKRAEFLQKQRAEIEQRNAATLAKIEEMKRASPPPQPPALSDAELQEALQLAHRVETASPAERDALDGRAQELLQHLHRR